MLGRFVEAEARQEARRAGGGGVGIDIGEPHVDLGDAVGVGGGFGFGQQAAALGVGGQHDVDQAFRATGRFLRDPADAGALGQADVAIVGRELAGDQAQQGGLAGAIAADEADLVASGNGGGRLVEQGAAFHPEGEIVDVQHGAGR